MKNDRLTWPILLLLLTVLVPSIGMVWMMREAVRNERVASGQRLLEAYQVQLESASQWVQHRWAAQLQESAEQIDGQNPAQSFAEIVSRDDVDSVLICDRQGRIVYPSEPFSSPSSLSDPEPQWAEAQRFEFAAQQFADAAEIYATLVREQSDATSRARARQAQVRCLLKLGETDAAIAVLEVQRQQQGIFDQQGRSFAAAAELRLLELLDRDSTRWNEIAQQLAQRLRNYQDDPMISSQRRFLMTHMQSITAQPMEWPTLDAETLAAEAAAVHDIDFASQTLRPTSLPNLWSCASPDGRVVTLYRTSTVGKRLLEFAEGSPLPRGVTFVTTPPQQLSENLIDASLGERLGGWRLGLSVTQEELFDANSQQRRATHMWIALLVVAVTCVLAWLLVGALRRRMRLARLKNDLVATVSHELKTPLASIRLLVDTLLDSDGSKTHEASLAKGVDQEESASEVSGVQVREYLQLISQENARLTRLIDNFLSFSRMEQGMQSLDLQLVDLNDVADQAAAVFREHRGDTDHSLQIAKGQPALASGDLDALVTAVVNLLENAWKYSDDPKQIELITDVDDQQVTLAVRDNGIGMSAREANRVFEQFFQVDQRVARTRGGCGLGLSIVKSIVQSHGGKAKVDSQPGIGSTFTLTFPKATDANERRRVAKESVQ